MRRPAGPGQFTLVVRVRVGFAPRTLEVGPLWGRLAIMLLFR